MENLRIVVVDDEPITRIDLAEILEGAGYDVVGSVSDGIDAVEICEKLRPDLVLMDIKLPLLDGIAASRIISEKELADTIILLTAYSDKQFIERAKDCNIAGYFVKPVSEKILIPNIEILVKKSREVKKLRKEMLKISERLESRVIIEQAKGYIMNTHSMNEQEAYEYIREISRKKNISMRKIAEMIVKIE